MVRLLFFFVCFWLVLRPATAGPGFLSASGISLFKQWRESPARKIRTGRRTIIFLKQPEESSTRRRPERSRGTGYLEQFDSAHCWTCRRTDWLLLRGRLWFLGWWNQCSRKGTLILRRVAAGKLISPPMVAGWHPRTVKLKGAKLLKERFFVFFFSRHRHLEKIILIALISNF